MFNLLCFSKFSDMLSNPKFWYTIILIIGAIMVLIACFKYPAVGKWVLLVVFYAALIGVTIYSTIQLNFYYKASGGIFGQIGNVFNPNEVKVVDDITYKFSNTELLQVGDTNTYKASVSIDEVLELTKGVKYQLLINDVPCGYTDNNEDYIVADYSYVFYNEDMSIALTDTLKIRIAFYKNSTSFTVSTDGGQTAVKYWNYYFNKNDFVIKLGTKSTTNNDKDYSNGDITNFATVRYFVNEGLDKTEIVYKGSKITYVPDVEKFECWLLNGEKIDDDFVVTGDIDLVSNTVPLYTCKFVVLGEEVLSQDIYKGDTCENFIPGDVISGNTKWIFDYWLVDDMKVEELKSYEILTNTTFVAKGHFQYMIQIAAYRSSELSTLGFWIESGKTINIANYLPNNYVITSCTVNGVAVSSTAYVVSEPVTILADGYLTYVVNFITQNDGESIVFNAQTIKFGENATVPNSNPVCTGKVFSGWSLDGHTIIEDMTAELSSIKNDKTFIAVFSDEVYTLTVLDSGNGNVIQTISQVSNSTLSLTTPTAVTDGASFSGWKILEGQGHIDGNIFTFGSSDCTIYACWDSASLIVGYKGENFNDKGKVIFTINDGEETTIAGAKIFTTKSGKIVVKTSAISSFIKEISTDGTYTQTGNPKNGYTITWENATYITIYLNGNNTQFV